MNSALADEEGHPHQPIAWDGDVAAPCVAVVRVLRPPADAATLSPRDLVEAPDGPKREAFLRRRAATRRFIAERLAIAPQQVEIGRDGRGATRILSPSTSLRLSVSGRGDFCALALAETPVGVDIEPLAPMTGPAWAALHPREAAHLQSLGDEAQGEAFFRLWTAKEAYLKALGEGFGRDPATIEITKDFDVIDAGRAIRLAVRGWRRYALHGAPYLVACVALMR